MRALADTFKKVGIDDPSLDARQLLCAAGGFDHAALIRDPDAPLGDDAAARLATFGARRAAREPVTRILGQRGFWSLELDVAPNVLDPRPDTEVLIEAAVAHFAERQDDALAIADLGSGSGAIVCALLDVFPRSNALAVDVSPDACALTERNLRRCGFNGRAAVQCAPWTSLNGLELDLVISNPPYIPTETIVGLDPEVARFDPHLALDGGPDGLNAYRELAETIPRLLAKGGITILEIGIDQAGDVAEIFRGNGFDLAATSRDLGGIDRALTFRLQTG